MPEIIIQKGRHSLLMLYDEESSDIIKSHTWKLTSDLYAVTNIMVYGKRKSVRCHRLLMDIWNPDVIVDHKNGDTLDNRLENLRTASITENGRNKSIINNKHGYKGITLKRGKFIAGLKFEGKTLKRGYFDTAIDAARHYDSMALHYYKEFACLNFPEDTPYDYEAWCIEATVKFQKHLSKQQVDRDARDTVINYILSNNGHFDTRLLQTYFTERGIVYTILIRTSYRGHLNNMIRAGVLRKETVPMDVNNHMVRYYKVV